MRKILSFCILILPLWVNAQNFTAWSEASSYISMGENMPFWLITNKEGRYFNNFSGGAIHAGFQKSINQDKLLDYAIGAEYNLSQGAGFHPWAHQYYAQVKLWKGQFTAGAKSETFGNQDSSLSTGGLLWSKNARPVPKVAISTDGYIDVPLTRGYFEFKLYMAHGWLEKERYTANPYLHQKYYWLRAGGDLPVHATFGFFHYAMWGGNSPHYGQITDDFDAFKRVFLINKAPKDSKIPGERINALGNHIGSRNFGLSIDMEKVDVKFYWQTVFEDNSGYAWRNIGDGLYGVKIRLKESAFMQHVLYEYIRTTDQSGPVHDIGDTLVLGGNDNYFNNGTYRSGWTHYRMTIGNPMLTSPRLSGSAYRIHNNVLIAHHLGVKGKLFNTYPYRALVTYSRNFGLDLSEDATYDEQVSSMFEMMIPFEQKNAELKLQFAMDMGTHYNSGLGFMVSFNKAFDF